MDIKSVQTSFSSVNLTTEKCRHCQRKIKSQVDLRNDLRNVQLQDEVLEWLKETYTGKPMQTLWGEKMKRLALKLKKPGGEERIRQKIQNYLKRVSSPFSECDEERREFRKHLPDTIIRKLKKMYLKPENKRRFHSSPVRIFRIEVPKCENKRNNTHNSMLRLLVDRWLKDIPIKKKDFLGRIIRKEDVIESVVHKIAPYILNRQHFDKDNLKLLTYDILKEIPVERDDYEKTQKLNSLALSLVHDLLNMDSIENNDSDVQQRSPTHGKEDLQDLNNFINREIKGIMNKLHLSICPERLQLLEHELKDTFITTVVSKSEGQINAARENIFIILHNLGGLSNYQANYFTDMLLKHFKDEFDATMSENLNGVNGCRLNALVSVPYSDTYSVFHNISKIKLCVSNNKRTNSRIDHKETHTCIYKQHIIEEIKDWLRNLNLQFQLKKSARDRAVIDLAEDVIDRFKYLEMNPSCKGIEDSELQYLKYQIFKWINKIAGENTKETIEKADELMNRIQAINEKMLQMTRKHKIQSSSSATKIATNNNGNKQTVLKDVITDWLNEQSDIKENINKIELISDFAGKLQKNITNLTDFNESVDKEIIIFINKVIKSKERPLSDELREILKATMFKNKDSKQEKTTIRKFEDIIDDWIDKVFGDMCEEIIEFKQRYENIHNLAVTLHEKIICKLGSKTNLEKIVYKWLDELPLRVCTNKKDLQKKCVAELIESLLSHSQSNETHVTRDLKETFSRSVIGYERHYTKDTVIKETKINASNLTVYGVTLPSATKGADFTETNIREINDEDVEANQQIYLRQLVQQIDEWLTTLQIPQIHDKGFREIVVNDLAGDIIDRHKYLELNQSSTDDENELDHLKYQIFKWINKLVGENQQETLERAPQLMNRIRNIPVPMLVKPSDRNNVSSLSKLSGGRNSDNNDKVKTMHTSTSNNNTLNGSNNSTNRNVMGEIFNVKSKTAPTPSNVRLSSPLGFTTGPMANSSQKSNQMRPANPTAAGESIKNVDKTGNKKDISGTSALYTHTEDSAENLPTGMTLDEVYPYFDNIFKQRVQEIPLQTPNPEQEMLAALARKGLYNGIWKTYFQLKADPDIENDYSYFELLFEEHLDNMLDCLPQTDEIQKIRPGWKSQLLIDVMTMLKYTHSLTDTPSFRQKIVDKFDRQFVKAQYQESSNLHQHGFVVRTAEAFILYSKYKEDNPIKAGIYRQRLMKTIEDLAEAVKRQNNVDFRYINQAQLCQIAMQLLESVPLPQDDGLNDEANEILVGEEIEQWYNALPVMPPRNETDEILRKRMRELLAKKLCELEKGNDIDDSTVETEMKHEVSKFLHEKAMLQENEDLNINFMVDELTNRLKTRKQNMLRYESFEKEKPISSTFVQTDPGEALAPLVDIGDYNGHIEGRSVAYHHSQGADPRDTNYTPGNELNMLSCPRQGVFETSPVRTSRVFESRPGIQINDSRRPSPGGFADMNQGRSSGLCPNQPDVSRPGQGNMSGVVMNGGLPNEGVAPCPRWRVSQEYNQGVIDRSNIQGGESGRVFGQAHLSSGQQQGPSTAFDSRDPSPTGATRSTARVANTNPEDMEDEVNEETDEVRVRCRCMERVWKCKRRRYRDDVRYPRCYPMPFPCRYFY